MPLVFSYGTLRQENVQLSTFGRLLQGRRDELPGFEESSVRPLRAGSFVRALCRGLAPLLDLSIQGGGSRLAGRHGDVHP